MADGPGIHRVTLTVDVPEYLVVTVTRQWIAMALANIVHNAFDAYRVGEGEFAEGEVLLRAAVEDRQLVITVADHACGIDPEALTQLQQFVPGTTSKRDRGTGYGLPLAYRYVSAHDGTLSIASEKGQGTTVTVTLPLEEDLPL